MEDRERLDRLTPRERDVYEVWREHPDWSNGQIGLAVMFPAAHIVRRYKDNIRRKLEIPEDATPPSYHEATMDVGLLTKLSPNERAVQALLDLGLNHAEISRRLLMSPHTIRTHLGNIEHKRERYERGEDIPVGP